MESTLGGAYFVDAELLERYDALKARLSHVRDDIAAGRVSGEDAMRSLDSIEKEIEQLRGQIEQARVRVSAFQVYTQTMEQTFELGDEKLVIVTGDNVRVRGWEGPGIKCVVEKTILSKSQPDDSAFDAIQVQHELKVAEDLVGPTREQRETQERAFLESEEGRRLNESQRAARREFVDEIHQSYAMYTAFQGRPANTLELHGLSAQEGNQNVHLEIASPDGGAMSASQWQRHATLTVYVPPCAALAVCGCQVGVDIQGVECDLVLTTHDSRDRNYNGQFEVRGVKGNVTIDQVPIRHLSDVSGRVRFVATDEFVNSGTLHEDDRRRYSPYETHGTVIEQIAGGLEAHFVRTNLRLRAIGGPVDVINEYGSTHWTVETADQEVAQRIVSQCGEIELEAPREVFGTLPIYAYTQCGSLATNLPREVLEEFDFSTGTPRRGWHGFITPSGERFAWSRFERPGLALENGERSAGLDLISQAGPVSIHAIDPSN